MRLNSIKPAPGAKIAKTRVGRGIGSGFGKTCGKGGKGQTARSGGSIRPGFEGGQQPLQRRLPKVGFNSMDARLGRELTLSDLNKIKGSDVSLETLQGAGLVAANIISVKVIASGKISKAVQVKGIKVSAGAKAAIEAAGGKVE